jgi:uncharacterized membrane protein (UPF0182 family)
MSTNRPRHSEPVNSDSDNPPTPIRPVRIPPRRRSWSRLWWILGAILLVIIIIPSILSEMITDWMWFGSQNLADVYTTRLWLALGVFFGAGILAVLVLYLNWMLAWRVSRPTTIYPGQIEPISRGLVRWVTLAVAIVIGFFLALAASGEWPTILLYIHGGTFGQTDPLFNNDIGFYVFSLPFFKLLRGWIVVLLVLAALGSIVIYVLGNLQQLSRQVTDFQTRGPAAARQSIRVELGGPIGVHLTILASIFLALIGVSYYFDRFDLLYSSRAVAYGAGYTDVTAKWPALNILMVITAIMVILLLVNIRVRTWRLLVGALGVWLVAFIVIGNIYPGIIQQFVVKPSESQLEKPYILNNIQATRQAFGLDKFTEQDVPAVTTITTQQINENINIVNNIRLWDYRPLLATYSQLQEIRPYYSFGNVDIDRYNISGTLRQVMLSAREMSVQAAAQSNANLLTWENEHVRYTHGYGAAVSPVNVIQGEGLPDLLVKNIPPVTNVPELKITRPEIYYGEQTNDYVFVDSSAVQEFDYPSSPNDAFTNYSGSGGVDVSSFINRLLFAVRFGDGNIMLSPYITPGTKVLFHRNVQDAAQMLAPFLLYDQDPYLVISGGKLYWILDAYTYTDKYPYSTPYQIDEFNSLNYIRNSVKVVMDAYSGDMNFYVVDPTDPIVNAYRGIFPNLFKDASQMPADLRAHWRYPERLLNIQADMYTTFHMTDPQVFYTKEDKWSIPAGSGSNSVVQPEAYYVNMQLPGSSKEGFMLIQPFTPNNKDNMIAWMAAQSDGENYGKVVVIRYPKQELIYGPNQVEARIDQDPVISQQLTLWNQSGSSVLRGNLLTIPISDTVLYVEPLFLQSTSGNSIPELKRVIVATNDSVGIGSDLNEALDVAFGIKAAQIITATGGTTPPAPTPAPGTTPAPTRPPAPTSATGRAGGTVADLTQSALDHYNRAQQALQNGDWTTYGQELDAMKADLTRMQTIIGTPTPAP